MKAFTRITGIAAPLPRDNVETDQIIPARLCVRPAGASYADALFVPWRYLADGSENPQFVLNQEPYRAATIIVAGANFGYGSSREHAAWALRDFGIRALVAASFAAIFAANCVRNGILPVTLARGAIDGLHQELSLEPRSVTVDLVRQLVTTPSGDTHSFPVAPLDRRLLLSGLDATTVVLGHEADIAAFQEADRQRRPWVYAVSHHGT